MLINVNRPRRYAARNPWAGQDKKTSVQEMDEEPVGSCLQEISIRKQPPLSTEWQFHYSPFPRSNLKVRTRMDNALISTVKQSNQVCQSDIREPTSEPTAMPSYMDTRI